MKKYLCIGYKWRLIVHFFKPKISWETRRKIEEELTFLRKKIKSKGEIDKEEFEDLKKFKPE